MNGPLCGLRKLQLLLFRGYAASAHASAGIEWIVTGGMTTDYKALDTQLMIESLGFVEMNFNVRAFQMSEM